MKFKKITARIKAVAITAAMMATTLITPSFTSLSTVTAADVTVNHKFTAVEPTDGPGPHKAKINIASLKGSSSVTFNFETSYSGNATFGVTGGEISKDPWWYDDDAKYELTVKGGKCSFTYNIPAEYKDIIKTVEIGLWYPQEGETFTLTTASTTGGTTVTPGPTPGPTPGNPSLPTSANTKSGAYTFKDNGDGTATISSTLTAEYKFPEEFAKTGYVLTQGYDEETMYPDGYDGEGPINSHKFPLDGFGIKDMTSVETPYKESFDIQSFEYTIESDYDLTNFQYGGGINVDKGTQGDTESVKGKDGYWYNDQGEKDMEEYGAKFTEELGFTPHGAYVADNIGKYAKVVWDVPKEVQPCITFNGSSAVSFQYWYGTSDELEEANANTPAALAEDDDPETPSTPSNVVKEVRIKEATCTYTKTAVVPFNTKQPVNKKVGATLTAGDESTTKEYEYMLSGLELGERDLISAIKFNVSSSSDIGKLVTAMGISVDLENAVADKGWYMTGSGNIIVLGAGKTQEIMWIVPSAIRNDVAAIYEDSKAAFYYWYGENGETLKLDSIDFYIYQSVEEELKVNNLGEGGDLVVAVGETKYLKPNVDGCTVALATGQVQGLMEIGDEEAGKGIPITGLKEGVAYVEVTSPEGQVVKVKVKVTGSAVTTTDPNGPGTTTSTTVVTTAKPTTTTNPVTSTKDEIDWSKVKYGDVNLDTNVNTLDIVLFNMYLLDGEKTPLNATQRENANCEYDKDLDMTDSGKIVNYVAEIIKIEKLGDPNFYKK